MGLEIAEKPKLRTSYDNMEAFLQLPVPENLSSTDCPELNRRKNQFSEPFQLLSEPFSFSPSYDVRHLSESIFSNTAQSIL